jgi:hypothetical protein
VSHVLPINFAKVSLKLQSINIKKNGVWKIACYSLVDTTIGISFSTLFPDKNISCLNLICTVEVYCFIATNYRDTMKSYSFRMLLYKSRNKRSLETLSETHWVLTRF